MNQNILDSSIVRYPSFFQDPQMYSQFLAMSSFLFLIKADDTSPKRQYLNYILFVILVFAIFLTGGRSGFLGLCIGLSIVFIVGENKLRFAIAACALIGYLVAIYLPGHFSLFSRQEGYDEAYAVRHQIWKEAYTVFANNPSLGIGTGNYLSYTQQHSLGGYYVINDEIVYYGTESGYLKILAESGVLGFVLTFLFIVLPVINAIKARIKKINNNNIFYLIAAIVCWFTAFSTLYTLSDKRTQVLLASLICLLITSVKKIEIENVSYR
ncbi:MAG: O-antigen ligase family protein [Bacteroidetes bacterium]|nr:O-antigen ligase family protein [Bacteroidota bacterium]